MLRIVLPLCQTFSNSFGSIFCTTNPQQIEAMEFEHERAMDRETTGMWCCPCSWLSLRTKFQFLVLFLASRFVNITEKNDDDDNSSVVISVARPDVGLGHVRHIVSYLCVAWQEQGQGFCSGGSRGGSGKRRLSPFQALGAGYFAVRKYLKYDVHICRFIGREAFTLHYITLWKF